MKTALEFVQEAVRSVEEMAADDRRERRYHRVQPLSLDAADVALAKRAMADNLFAGTGWLVERYRNGRPGQHILELRPKKRSKRRRRRQSRKNKPIGSTNGNGKPPYIRRHGHLLKR